MLGYGAMHAPSEQSGKAEISECLDESEVEW